MPELVELDSLPVCGYLAPKPMQDCSVTEFGIDVTGSLLHSTEPMHTLAHEG
jgi:hypothetical protein